MSGPTPNIMRPPQFAIEHLINALPTWWENAVMVEIGCYQGESTEGFAKSGKFSLIHAVDPWSNEVYDPNDKATMHCDMALVEAAFDARMQRFGAMIHKQKMHSAEAADAFRYRDLDFVYIDGDHRYESVLEDIHNWVGKIRPGGILAGHDYGTHPGPVRAVDEVFGEPDAVFKDYSWMVLV